MSWWNKAIALASLLAVGACGWTETAGDFTYRCKDGAYVVDGPSCEHRLTDHYLLRYGEGSGDYAILAYQFDENSGSGGLIDQREDIIVRLGLDDRLLTMQTRSGLIYVAAAYPQRYPDIIGPLSEHEFAARYPSAPPWRDVQ